MEVLISLFELELVRAMFNNAKFILFIAINNSVLSVICVGFTRLNFVLRSGQR